MPGVPASVSKATTSPTARCRASSTARSASFPTKYERSGVVTPRWSSRIRPPGVLGVDERCLAQRFAKARGSVAEIADGSGAEDQSSGHAVRIGITIAATPIGGRSIHSGISTIQRTVRGATTKR